MQGLKIRLLSYFFRIHQTNIHTLKPDTHIHTRMYKHTHTHIYFHTCKYTLTKPRTNTHMIASGKHLFWWLAETLTLNTHPPLPAKTTAVSGRHVSGQQHYSAQAHTCTHTHTYVQPFLPKPLQFLEVMYVGSSVSTKGLLDTRLIKDLAACPKLEVGPATL